MGTRTPASANHLTTAALAAISALGMANPKAGEVRIVQPAGVLPDAECAEPLPQHLSDTGLFVPGSTTEIRPENLPFSPQYPLWSDGAAKRRWLYLPPGTSIDAALPDAWEFPPGTRLWKEFSYGRPLETRFISRCSNGSWRYATYIWNAAGTNAALAPTEGIASLQTASAPGGEYPIPAEADCRACHEGTAVPVLGVSALQLSPDRDPLAPHADSPGAEAVDLRALNTRGLLQNMSPNLLEIPPRIAATTPVARAALGYLHGNCGHCHNEIGALAPLELVLAQDPVQSPSSSSSALRSTLAKPSQIRLQGAEVRQMRIATNPHQPSTLLLRMESRLPAVQMPPLGTRIPDTDGLALVQRWIHELQRPKEITP